MPTEKSITPTGISGSSTVTRQFTAVVGTPNIPFRGPSGTTDANLYTLIDEGVPTYDVADYAGSGGDASGLTLKVDPTTLESTATVITSVDVSFAHSGLSIITVPACTITLKSSTTTYASKFVSMLTVGVVSEFITFSGLSIPAADIDDLIVDFDWADGSGAEEEPFPNT